MQKKLLATPFACSEQYNPNIWRRDILKNVAKLDAPNYVFIFCALFYMISQPHKLRSIYHLLHWNKPQVEDNICWPLGVTRISSA